MKIYVGNLSFRTSEAELREKFEEFGNVSQVDVITDRETGRSKGFAFVEMNNNDEANAAINAMNGFNLGDRELRVNEARPREERPRGGGGGRGGYGGGGGGRDRRY